MEGIKLYYPTSYLSGNMFEKVLLGDKTKLDIDDREELIYERKKQIARETPKWALFYLVTGAVSFILGIVVFGISVWFSLSLWISALIWTFAVILMLIGFYLRDKAKELEIEIELYEKEKHEAEKKRVRHCVECGRIIPYDASICPYCGHIYDEFADLLPLPDLNTKKKKKRR